MPPGGVLTPFGAQAVGAMALPLHPPCVLASRPQCLAVTRATFRQGPLACRCRPGRGMTRSTDRILTTHAGSLPRPDGLRDLLARVDNGRLADDDPEFRARVRE